MNAVSKFYMLSRTLYLKKVPFLPRLLEIIIRILFSCDLPYTSNVHPTVQFGHNGMGIVLHPKSSVGKNTLIMQHVTIGGNNGKVRVYNGEEIGHPIIGENVFIGTGAVILGPVIIGDNAKIGANAVVIKDVPENKIALGIPARIVN